ncbi:MAG: type II toxin-antitoxin system RelE/ParE family toxin [Pseudomonadota bacterium]
MAARGFALTPKARRDLDEVFAYSVERFGLAQAERYYWRLIGACEAIAQDLRSTRPAPGRSEFRLCSEGSHVIVFRQSEARVEVHGFLHKRMNLTARLSTLRKNDAPPD